MFPLWKTRRSWSNSNKGNNAANTRVVFCFYGNKTQPNLTSRMAVLPAVRMRHTTKGRTLF